MIITKKTVSRRLMLRGIGASLALPLLDAMVPAAVPLRKTAARAVRRLGIIYVPNGIVMNHWTPITEGTKFDLPSILEPLDPFRLHALGNGLVTVHDSTLLPAGMEESR